MFFIYCCYYYYFYAYIGSLVSIKSITLIWTISNQCRWNSHKFISYLHSQQVLFHVTFILQALYQSGFHLIWLSPMYLIPEKRLQCFQTQMKRRSSHIIKQEGSFNPYFLVFLWCLLFLNVSFFIVLSWYFNCR